MDEVERIARGLSKAQREARLYGIGHKRLPKVVIEMAELGLATVFPAAMGWNWRPTDLGLAVRNHLGDTNG